MIKILLNMWLKCVREYFVLKIYVGIYIFRNWCNNEIKVGKVSNMGDNRRGGSHFSSQIVMRTSKDIINNIKIPGIFQITNYLIMILIPN